jgi:hypothetical protein
MKNPLRIVSDPLRTALAAAIADVYRIEDEQKAKQVVQDRASAMVDRALAGLQKAQQEAAVAREAAHARMVAAMTSGGDVAPDASAREARLRVEDAEECYAHALQALAEVQWTPDNQLSEANARVRIAASTIMGGPIDSLMREARELQAALAAKRMALVAIARYVEPAQRSALNSYLGAPLFPDELNYEAHPVVQTWRDAFAALQRNANAELPHA